MLLKDELPENPEEHALNDGSTEMSAMSGKSKQPTKEGEGMGGHNFGKTVHSPAGDDPANPSRNAGYTNPYFRRTEPTEEDTANNNFKTRSQQGEPDYSAAQMPTPDLMANPDDDDRIEHIET